MAKIPIEIIDITKKYGESIFRVLNFANELQNDFDYQLLELENSKYLDYLSISELDTEQAMNHVEELRKNLKGFHPHILVICDSYLYNDLYNIFGSSRAKKGLGILTFYNVPDIIIPKDKLDSYLLYYLARYSLAFLNPEQKNHDDTRNCLYDRKISKVDILKSFKANAFCHDCLDFILNSSNSIVSPAIFDSINILLGETENIISSVAEENYINALRNLSKEYKIEEINELIKGGNILHACEELLRLENESLDLNLEKRITLIIVQLKKVKSDFHLSFISYENYSIKEANLSYEVISILKDLKQNFPDNRQNELFT